MLASGPHVVNASSSLRPRWLLLAGSLLALAARAALVLAGHGQPPLRWEYDALVASLLAGRGLVYEHLFGVPYQAYYSGLAYLGLLAGCERLAPGAAWPIQALQALASVGAGLAVYCLARRVAGPPTALAAALVTWFHPGLLHYDVAQVHPLSLDTACGLLALLASLRAADLPTAGRVTAAGTALGVAILQRGSLLPLLLLWPLAARRHRRALALVALVALVPVAGWCLRNASVMGRPVLTSTSGEHFWIGNAPGSSGGALLASGQPVIETAPPALAVELAAGDELGQQRAFWRAGLAEVQAHPARFALGLLAKAARFWSLAPQSGLRYPAAWSVGYLLLASVLLACAALGAWRVARDGDDGARLLLGLSLATLGAVTLAHALLYFELRHRFALDPLLAVLAAGLATPPRRV